MDEHNLAPTAAALAYMEAHLEEKLDLDAVAEAVRYSKYHLHRLFTDTVGLTPHDYLRRRRLTEAARRLACSEEPVLAVALLAGYGSQQAFTAAFKAMYKRTPLAYRRRGAFYPLQLALPLGPGPSARPPRVVLARPEDLSRWMAFLPLVAAGFPCLDLEAHRERVRESIRRRQVLLALDGGAVVGAAAFSRRTGHIGFLAVHPQYRRCSVEEALLAALRPLAGRPVSITTFREGDRADPGQRAAYRRLGFTGGELLTEFGYPVQRLVLPPEGEP